MRVKVQVEDLTEDQFRQLDKILKTSYRETGMAPVCVIFTREDLERHVQMPVYELGNAVHLLNLVGMGAEILHMPNGQPYAVEALPSRGDR